MATIDEAVALNLKQWAFETDYDEFKQAAENMATMFLPYMTDGLVVDLGGGDGAAEQTFLDAGHEYLCVDINPKKLERVKTGKVESEIYAWLKAQPDNSVPNIFCHQVLEHLANPSEVAQECARVANVVFIEARSEPINGCHVVHIKSVDEITPDGVEVLDSDQAAPNVRVIWHFV